MLEAKGKIESFQLATDKSGKAVEGVREDGSEWKSYKYKIGGRFYSGFKTLKELEIEIGDFVIVAYEEAPNPNNASKPYKNLKNLTKATNGVAEADEQYNVKEVGETPTTPLDKRDEEPAFFGMVSNQTVKIILIKKLDFKENFSVLFDTVWDENLKKRKEKLGY